MTLGEKLQTLRRSRGLSQEQLAEILEVSRQAVSKWENGDSAPDLDRLRAICTYFGVTTDYLIWDEPEDAPRGAEEARSRETQRKPLRETVRGFRAILDGEMDDYPEAAFYNVGTIDDALQKAAAIKEGKV